MKVDMSFTRHKIIVCFVVVGGNLKVPKETLVLSTFRRPINKSSLKPCLSFRFFLNFPDARRLTYDLLECIAVWHLFVKPLVFFCNLSLK